MPALPESVAGTAMRLWAIVFAGVTSIISRELACRSRLGSRFIQASATECFAAMEQPMRRLYSDRGMAVGCEHQHADPCFSHVCLVSARL